MTRAHPPGKKRSRRPRSANLPDAGPEAPQPEPDAAPPEAVPVPDPQQFVHSAEGFWKAAGRFGRLR